MNKEKIVGSENSNIFRIYFFNIFEFHFNVSSMNNVCIEREYLTKYLITTKNSY